MDLPFRVKYLDAERMLPVLGANSSLKGGHEGQARALEWADVRAPSGRAKAETLVSARQDGPQFPLRPYNSPQKSPHSAESEPHAVPN